MDLPFPDQKDKMKIDLTKLRMANCYFYFTYKANIFTPLVS